MQLPPGFAPSYIRRLFFVRHPYDFPFQVFNPAFHARTAAPGPWRNRPGFLCQLRRVSVLNPQPLADPDDQAACGPQLEDHLHRPFHRRLCRRPGCPRPARSGVPDDTVSECESGLALLIRLVPPGTGQGPILPCSLRWLSGWSCACSVRVTAGRRGSS